MLVSEYRQRLHVLTARQLRRTAVRAAAVYTLAAGAAKGRVREFYCEAFWECERRAPSVHLAGPLCGDPAGLWPRCLRRGKRLAARARAVLGPAAIAAEVTAFLVAPLDRPTLAALSAGGELPARAVA